MYDQELSTQTGGRSPNGTHSYTVAPADYAKLSISWKYFSDDITHDSRIVIVLYVISHILIIYRKLQNFFGKNSRDNDDKLSKLTEGETALIQIFIARK